MTGARLIPSRTVSEPAVRPARATDAETVAPLLYASASAMYDRFAGSGERALALLARAVDTPGNSASAEVVAVGELEGRPAGAMAAFPVAEAPARARAFLRLTLRSIPPVRWPGALWLYWAGAHAAPTPPEATLYVDALAVDESARRRGVARALLAHAESEARRRHLPAVSLDTSLDNEPARALYQEAGYDEVAYRPPARGLPGFVALVKPLS
jgi:ribosomal protein S18 acetylase RimI-like enzyme